MNAHKNDVKLPSQIHAIIPNTVLIARPINATKPLFVSVQSLLRVHLYLLGVHKQCHFSKT